MKYIVYITEEHTFKIEVEADSEDDALDQATANPGKPYDIETIDLTIEVELPDEEN